MRSGVKRVGRRAARHVHEEQRLHDLMSTLTEMDGYDVGTVWNGCKGPVREADVPDLRLRVHQLGHPCPSDGTPLGADALREILGSHAD